jgi:predicted  nucleic acid-binding Zn ribbon protein
MSNDDAAKFRKQADVSREQASKAVQPEHYQVNRVAGLAMKRGKRTSPPTCSGMASVKAREG